MGSKVVEDPEEEPVNTAVLFAPVTICQALDDDPEAVEEEAPTR